MIPAGNVGNQPSKKSNQRKMRILVLTICFLFVSMALFAQELQGNKDLLKRKVSLNAEDAALSNVLSTLARMSDCNIVLSVETGQTQAAAPGQPQQEKKITIHVKDLPIEQALSLVVKSAGLSYRLVGENTFLVGEKSKINEEVGRIYFDDKKNYQVAATFFEKLTKLEPANLRTLYNLGACHFRTGNFEKAFEAWSEIKKRDPKFPNIDAYIRSAERKTGTDEIKTTVIAPDAVPEAVEKASGTGETESKNTFFKYQ